MRLSKSQTYKKFEKKNPGMGDVESYSKCINKALKKLNMMNLPEVEDHYSALCGAILESSGTYNKERNNKIKIHNPQKKS